MKIKGLIFDMDGVIMDSMGMWNTLVIDYLKTKNIEASEEFSRSLFTNSMIQAAQRMVEEYDMDMTPEDVVADVNDYISDFYINKVMPKEKAEEGLRELKDEELRICLATSTDRPLVETAMKRVGLLDCFEFILTSTEIGTSKDEPNIFLEAAKRFGLEPEELLVVEDNHVAVKTAGDAGFKTCGVYDRHEEYIYPVLVERADLTVHYLTEIKPWLGL